MRLLVLLVAAVAGGPGGTPATRGDPADEVERRLAKGDQEVLAGHALGAIEVVNDDLDRHGRRIGRDHRSGPPELADPGLGHGVWLGCYAGRPLPFPRAPVGRADEREVALMAQVQDTMMNPRIEDLMGKVESKFRLVTLAALRARQINSYFGQLGEGLGADDPAAGHLGGPQAAVDRVRGDLGRQDRGHPGHPGRRRRHRGSSGRRARVVALPHRRTMLAGRTVVLGVTGGIAAYKAVEVCRRLVDAGAHVAPVLTEGATRFIGATTFSALASEPVQTSLFDERDPIPHTRLGQKADLDRRVPGHRPPHRLLRRRHQRRSAHGHAAGHPGARW